ncbi:unnamed protein product [Pleuronectes platessa]|uniref:Uncharacterized protein n=1 Tax=Pleuronectes platessa TaxID=8262 RepID=A0A9N7TT81_PLEPL|nr:unnamed protein product [Pleuronectes platessa]
MRETETVPSALSIAHSRPIVKKDLPIPPPLHYNMDNSDEPEDLLDGKIVFQNNKDRTFSKTKVFRMAYMSSGYGVPLAAQDYTWCWGSNMEPCWTSCRFAVRPSSEPGPQ